MSEHNDLAVCTECHSDQPDNYAIKQLKMGWDNFPCKWCGGVALLVLKKDREAALRKSDTRRGL